ncbi:MAG: endonuclease, partial [Gelidibacter sp.]|nr:endonuclease [Gelidibacter sp.]
NTFETLEEAGLSVNASKKSINNVCLGVNKTCKGFYWSYTQVEPFEWQNDTRKKKVMQTDLNNIPLAEYESVAEASRQSGISKTCISRVCRGEREQSGSFLWNYI